MRMLAIWESEDSIKKSEQNKRNRSCNSGQESITYARGSINIDEHRKGPAKERGSDPSYMNTFERTFQKKDKTWSGERTKAISEKYNKLLAHLSGGDDGASSEQSVNNMVAWLEAFGG